MPLRVVLQLASFGGTADTIAEVESGLLTKVFELIYGSYGMVPEVRI